MIELFKEKLILLGYQNNVIWNCKTILLEKSGYKNNLHSISELKDSKLCDLLNI